MDGPDTSLGVSHGASPVSTSAWRVAVPALALLLLLIVVIYRDTAVAMVTIWYRSETFTHAFVVLPITLWLVWRQRQQLAGMTPRPSMGLLMLVAALAFLWLLGDLVAVNALTQFALVAMLVAAVPAVLGLSVARAIAFPLAFLFFMVPVGEFLLPQLMDWTANFTILALRISGIPVYREGLQFVIPSGRWSVVEACSGVRYLIASLTVGTLFAYLNYQSTRRRMLFILVSIVVPIIANWMRAYMIVMLGHLSGNKIAVGVDHLIYGWVFFGIVILLMFIIGARWSEPEPDPAVGAGALPPTMSTTAVFAPGRLVLAVTCVAVIAALPFGVLWNLSRYQAAAGPRLVAPVALDAGWQAGQPGSFGYKPAFHNPAAEISGAYSKADQTVGLYIAYYRQQTYQSKLVSSENTLVLSSDLDWSRVGSTGREVVLGQQPVRLLSSELRRLRPAPVGHPERLVAWQIYWVNGTLTANDYLAKAYSAVYQLMGRGDDSAVIIVYAAQERDVEAVLSGFLSANFATLDGLLRQAARSE